jgi:hypothetical protein
VSLVYVGSYLRHQPYVTFTGIPPPTWGAVEFSTVVFAVLPYIKFVIDIMSFITILIAKYYQGNQIKKDEMG